MAAAPDFKRTVLGLDFQTLDPDVVHVAAALAERLELRFVGLFALDDTLRRLAGYPMAREFLPAGREWRPIDPDRMARDQKLAVQSAQRTFMQLAQTLRVPSTFEIVPATAGKVFELVSTSDILVVAAPRGAAASVTYSSTIFLEAAVRSTASVLMVPRAARQRKGPIVVVAASPDDPSIDVACTIASAAQEELIIVEGYEHPAAESPSEHAAASALLVERIHGGDRSLTDASYLSALLGNRRESLIILMRGELPIIPSSFCALVGESRDVPVLLLEPSHFHASQ